MISYLEGPHDDETLGSMLARAVDRISVGGLRRFNAHIRGCATEGFLNLDYPQQLPEIAARIGARLGLDTDTLVQRLSFLSLIAPFLEPQILQRLQDSFTGKIATPPARLLRGTRPLGDRRPHLRFCPRCRDADIRRHGFTWWRRTHQVAGVECCAIHSVALARSQFLNTPTWRINFPLADDACEMDREAAPSAAALAIARDAQWLLGHKVGAAGAETLRRVYVDALDEKGLLHRGRLRRSEFLHQFFARLDNAFLSRHGLGFDFENTYAWPTKVVLTEPSRSRPLHHLLVIRFLGLSAPEFFDRVQTAVKTGRRLAARQQCSIPEEQLRKLWLNPKITINAAAADLNVQPRTATAWATTLGLPLLRPWHTGRRAKTFYKSRVRFREVWRKLRNSAQSAVRLEARKWLCCYDRAWLVRHPGKPTAQVSRIDWVARDRLLAPQLSYVVARIRSQRPFRRICRTSIARHVKPAESIMRHLHRMPLTQSIIARNAEDPRAFILRRIRTVRQMHPEYPPWHVRTAAFVPKHYEDPAMVRAIEDPIRSMGAEGC